MRIWSSLLKKPGNVLFEDLLESVLSSGRRLQFIEQWMHSTNDKLQILAIFASIERLSPKYPFIVENLPKIKKMAQVNILEIEITSHDPVEVKSDDQTKVETFLSSTESRFFKCMRLHPSAFDVYKLIREDKANKIQAFAEKKERAEDRINEGIEKSSMQFRFR
jgi:hypothetical protein